MARPAQPYDLKKFRGQQIVERIGQTHRRQASPAGLKAITALIVLRDKAIKPLLAGAQGLRPRRGARNPRPLDAQGDRLNLCVTRGQEAKSVAIL